MQAVLAALTVATLAGCGSGADEPQAGSTTTVTATVTTTVTATGSPTSVVVPSETGAPTTPSEPSEPSSSDPAPIDLGDPPGTFEAAMAHVATADSSVTLPRFQTAHGAVYCLLQDRYNPPSCEVVSSGAIPDESYCGDGPAGTSVGRLEFDGTKPRAICNSDTIRGESASTVAPGTVVSASGGAVECVVESIGVTCVDTRAQTGFFLTRGRYTVFG